MECVWKCIPNPSVHHHFPSFFMVIFRVILFAPNFRQRCAKQTGLPQDAEAAVRRSRSGVAAVTGPHGGREGGSRILQWSLDPISRSDISGQIFILFPCLFTRWNGLFWFRRFRRWLIQMVTLTGGKSSKRWVQWSNPRHGYHRRRRECHQVTLVAMLDRWPDDGRLAEWLAVTDPHIGRIEFKKYCNCAGFPMVSR